VLAEQEEPEDGAPAKRVRNDRGRSRERASPLLRAMNLEPWTLEDALSTSVIARSSAWTPAR